MVKNGIDFCTVFQGPRNRPLVSPYNYFNSHHQSLAVTPIDLSFCNFWVNALGSASEVGLDSGLNGGRSANIVLMRRALIAPKNVSIYLKTRVKILYLGHAEIHLP